MSWSQLINPIRESTWRRPRGEHHVSRILSLSSWLSTSLHFSYSRFSSCFLYTFSFCFSTNIRIFPLSLQYSHTLTILASLLIFGLSFVLSLSVQLTDQCGCMQMASSTFSTRVTPELSCRLNAFSQIHTSSLEVTMTLLCLCVSVYVCVEYMEWNVQDKERELRYLLDVLRFIIFSLWVSTTFHILMLLISAFYQVVFFQCPLLVFPFIS